INFVNDLLTQLRLSDEAHDATTIFIILGPAYTLATLASYMRYRPLNNPLAWTQFIVYTAIKLVGLFIFWLGVSYYIGFSARY
ncbi:hypothetical protein B7Y94_05470, partial [Candidatus Saccharibacteria bacterium 32-49-12]